MGLGEEKFSALLTYCFYSLIRVEFQCLLLFLVLFGGQLFIENHVTLMPKVHAANTVRAANTIAEKVAITAVFRVDAVPRGMALRAVHTFVAEFGLVDIAAVHNRVIVIHTIAVHATLVVVSLCQKIAILQVARTVHILAILERSRTDELSLTGDCVKENEELFEEGLLPIDFATVGEFIPLVRDPLIRMIDRERDVTVGRDELSSSKIALPFVEITGVSFIESANKPAVSALVWRRHIHVLLKAEFVLWDSEYRRAVGTGFLHRNGLYLNPRPRRAAAEVLLPL